MMPGKVVCFYFLMKKPTTKTKEALDYNECTRFIEDKYKIKVRDYAGKFANGCLITMSSEDLWNIREPWQKEILAIYLKEFGDPVEFWVDW